MLRRFLVLFLLSWLSACTAVYKANNSGITAYDAQSYRTSYFTQVRPIGDTLVVLAFSGGGTRAAALSYGVLQELRDTQFRDAD